MDNIVVYGMGIIGKKIAKKLKTLEEINNFQIIAFVDKQYESIDSEFEVISPLNLNKIEYDYILITSEKWFKEMADELVDNNGVNREKIIHLKQLIREEKHYCNLCNTKVPFLLDAEVKSPIFTKREIIGGGERKNSICPICGSIDRERWLFHLLFHELQIGDGENSILHFAPEKQIEKYFRKNKKLTYVTADIEQGRADRIEDITNMSFMDQSFDIIICNHVLEHVKDEEKAFKELKRCIKKNGKIILSVPICWEINTFEDSSIVTREDRLREYGQEDHVRLYGKDIEQRLKENGFKVEYYQVDYILQQDKIENMRLIPKDRVWGLTPV